MYIWLYRYTYILCLYTYLCNYAYLRISLATGRGPVPGYLHVLSWWHCLQHGFSSNNRHRTPCRAQRELLQHRNIIFVYMFTRIFIYIYILYCIAYYYVSIYTYIIYVYIYIYLFTSVMYDKQMGDSLKHVFIWFYTPFFCVCCFPSLPPKIQNPIPFSGWSMCWRCHCQRFWRPQRFSTHAGLAQGCSGTIISWLWEVVKNNAGPDVAYATRGATVR